MTARSWALAALTGCFGGHELHEEHAEHAEHAEAEEHHDEAPEGELRVSADVLRDLRVTTAVARVGGTDERATALGELAVDEGRYAEVGTPLMARVREALVDLGAQVAAGAPLVELESAELGRARAEVALAQARLRAAEGVLSRKRAVADGAMSARELDAAAADVAIAQAELEASRAGLRALGVGESPDGGGVFVLRAPVAGEVLSRDAHRGEVVGAEDTLVRVADLQHLWLVVHTFERDALRVVPDGAVEVAFAALPNRRFTGVVSRVGREVDAVSRTVPVRVSVDNPEGLLRPGMSATALLPLGSAGTTVTVPAMAVQRCDAGWCTFVPRAEGRFEVRPVGRGRELGTEVELLSGLAEGETVVVEGAFLLRAESAKQAGGGDAHHH